MVCTSLWCPLPGTQIHIMMCAHTQKCGWYLLSTQHHTGCAKQLLPLRESQGKRVGPRKQLTGFSMGMSSLALRSIKPHNHPCIFESGCQGKERNPRAPGIGRTKKKSNKATQDFLFLQRNSNSQRFELWAFIATEKNCRKAAGIYINTLDQYFPVGWSLSDPEMWLTGTNQEECLISCDLEKLQLQADRNLLLKQRQMQCPVLRMEKSISTGWGANSCWAVLQNHRITAGLGLEGTSLHMWFQPPTMSKDTFQAVH